jgi:hypothetical protein
MSYSDSGDLYLDILSHLQYLLSGSKLYYLSPHGGYTLITVKDIDVHLRNKKVDDVVFYRLDFVVTSDNRNVYNINDLYTVEGDSVYDNVFSPAYNFIKNGGYGSNDC